MIIDLLIYFQILLCRTGWSQTGFILNINGNICFICWNWLFYMLPYVLDVKLNLWHINRWYASASLKYAMVMRNIILKKQAVYIQIRCQVTRYLIWIYIAYCFMFILIQTKTLLILLFISYKFVKGFLAITFLLLIIYSWNLYDMCPRFLCSQKWKFIWIRQIIFTKIPYRPSL